MLSSSLDAMTRCPATSSYLAPSFHRNGELRFQSGVPVLTGEVLISMHACSSGGWPDRFLPNVAFLFTIAFFSSWGKDVATPKWGQFLVSGDGVVLDPAKNDPLIVQWSVARSGVEQELQLDMEVNEVAVYNLDEIRVGIILGGELVGRSGPLDNWNAQGEALGSILIRDVGEGTAKLQMILLTEDGPVGRATAIFALGVRHAATADSVTADVTTVGSDAGETAQASGGGLCPGGETAGVCTARKREWPMPGACGALRPNVGFPAAEAFEERPLVVLSWIRWLDCQGFDPTETAECAVPCVRLLPRRPPPCRLLDLCPALSARPPPHP